MLRCEDVKVIIDYSILTIYHGKLLSVTIHTGWGIRVQTNIQKILFSYIIIELSYIFCARTFSFLSKFLFWPFRLTRFLHPWLIFSIMPSFWLSRSVSPSLYRHSLSKCDQQRQQQQCMPSHSVSSAKLRRTTKRKTESSPLENIIGPVLECTHGLPRTVYTNTDEVLLLPCEQLLNYNIFPSASGWEGASGSGGGEQEPLLKAFGWKE